jgi:hypothetical protein
MPARDIHFVCLPVNSTRITQPLDVAVFHPMKVAWREIMTEWKKTPEGLKSSVLPKQQFPMLLNKLFEVLEPNFKTNLQSGFKKCGVMPCSVEPLPEGIARKEVHGEFCSS